MLASISVLFIVWALFIVYPDFPLWVTIVTSVISLINIVINVFVFWVGIKAVNSNTQKSNIKNK